MTVEGRVPAQFSVAACFGKGRASTEARRVHLGGFGPITQTMLASAQAARAASGRGGESGQKPPDHLSGADAPYFFTCRKALLFCNFIACWNRPNHPK